ncbi:MAG: amidohydrolase family protein [Anaerolineae bacterium]|jgi:5-methylthioadenosine/S-adenosylhomocysteine deaminase|nr:amidohydrolase family protein [Anaerolineae bacterium]MBT7189086.1 amidohydrolase family protein [Anaerolineae bacterium]MBT7990359.1 amidohydrolase family protein [Anaerolineae bacterium]
MPESIKTLIIHAHLFTMQGDGVGYIPDGAVAVKDGRIVDVGATSELDARYQASETINASGCALLPGLVDAHMHTYWAIARGVAQDVGNWMQAALSPYARHATPEAKLAGTKLNVVEALKAGTTMMMDYVPLYDGWAEFYEKAGVRARLTPMINALPKTGMAGLKLGALYPYDDDAAQMKIEASQAFIQAWHGAADGRITAMWGPQGPDMLSEDHLIQIKKLAEREGLMIHMHVAQGDREMNQMLKRYGARTPEYLANLGYLDEQLLAVHLTEATDEEAAMMAKSGARMILCSGSIGIIDGIVPPMRAFREAGGLVALGSDQASGNNVNNIFNEMKLTALFNKIMARDPEVMPAWEVLRMATIEGARAIGLGDKIGSLEKGKQADLILVDLTAPNLTPVLVDPVRNIVPNLVYAASGHEVKTVMVAGKILMRDREVLTLDEAAVQAEAQEQAEMLSRRVAEDSSLHGQMALMAAMEEGRL